jgi:asparagine synthase (glutamine-hydrolysing)
MGVNLNLDGWAELEGIRQKEHDLQELISRDPRIISRLGGEFFLSWNGCMARDHFGIVSGDCPPGAIVCDGRKIGYVNPSYTTTDLYDAIELAVHLRSDEGIVALSGGIDSSLVADIAELECLVVGIDDSHDLIRAAQVAKELNLSLESVVIQPKSIEEALVETLKVIPKITPIDASVATTLYFVTMQAAIRGYRRILAGQGADELFGGYARYLQSKNLAKDLERDFLCLGEQVSRDQAVASIHKARFSLPYMDMRVVQVALSIPPEEKVCDGIRKKPLRDIAAFRLPHSIAFYEKKAMQYGSGIWKEIQRLANKSGYKNSVQSYLVHLSEKYN